MVVASCLSALIRRQLTQPYDNKGVAPLPGTQPFPAKAAILPPFGGILPPFCHPLGFESGRGQPLSGTQGKRVATFALVTTVGPQPRPARSTSGEPGLAADRQAFAAWFKRRSQLRGAWGRRPKGDAPRS